MLKRKRAGRLYLLYESLSVIQKRCLRVLHGVITLSRCCSRGVRESIALLKRPVFQIAQRKLVSAAATGDSPSEVSCGQ